MLIVFVGFYSRCRLRGCRWLILKLIFKVVLRLNMQISYLAVLSQCRGAYSESLHQLHMRLTRPSGIKRVKGSQFISVKPEQTSVMDAQAE